MQFHELLKSRRSIRNYQDRPVSVSLVKEIIEESTLAPNAGNEQPWKFVIVNDKELLKRMSDESKHNTLERIAGNPGDYAKKYMDMLQNESFNVFFNAPCLVLILGPSSLKNLFVDCALAASYFMFAAVSRDLGTCWVNLGKEIKSSQLINELGIPDNCQIVAPITIGYPTKIPAIPKRNKPEILKILT